MLPRRKSRILTRCTLDGWIPGGQGEGRGGRGGEEQEGPRTPSLEITQ